MSLGLACGGGEGWIRRRREAEPVARDGKIDVYGKTFEDAEGFGQGCAATEGEMWSEIGLAKEGCENPADPEVFFDVARGNAHLLCHLLIGDLSPIGGELEEVVHALLVGLMIWRK